jgi:hypothetical protein
MIEMLSSISLEWVSPAEVNVHETGKSEGLPVYQYKMLNCQHSRFPKSNSLYNI